MRLTNANKVLLTLVILLVSCHYKPERSMIIGNWKYISVHQGETPAFEISDNDHLSLSEDSSFYYRIESINKSMKGTWNYTGHTLHLHYTQPDTTRHFNIDVLTKYNLNFHEGDLHFKMNRID